MKFMDKNLEELVVTLPFADGREVDCGVVASFEIGEKTYLALLPLTKDGKPDFFEQYMIYRVEEDEEDSPVVEYIEDDYEYEKAAAYFTDNYLNRTLN